MHLLNYISALQGTNLILTAQPETAFPMSNPKGIFLKHVYKYSIIANKQ